MRQVCMTAPYRTVLSTLWSMPMFDALAYPFMQRALAAGVLVG